MTFRKFATAFCTRIREAIYGRFIEDPLFGKMHSGRVRTYDVDWSTRRFKPKGWINEYQGAVHFRPLELNLLIRIYTTHDGGPTEFHRNTFRQLEAEWQNLA